MPEEVTGPVVLDTTVLSNFASTGGTKDLVGIIDRPASVVKLLMLLSLDNSGFRGMLEFRPA